MAFVFACLLGDTIMRGCGHQTGGSSSDSTTAFVLLTLSQSFVVAFGLAFEVLEPLPFLGFFLMVFYHCWHKLAILGLFETVPLVELWLLEINEHIQVHNDTDPPR